MALGAVDAAVEVRDEGKRGLMISGIGNTEEGRKAVMVGSDIFSRLLVARFLTFEPYLMTSAVLFD